jgi:2-oxo-4-hydroxy-4-carboxy-5-ureidoimidazoline decarboxylase
VTLQELNALDRNQFVERVGWVFEHSPWTAFRAWEKRPFSSIDALHRALEREVVSAGPHQQLELLRAHPDLGTRATMSASSTGEQAGAGLDRLPPELFARLQQLNTAYRDKFGFPFLFAVKGSTVAQILEALETRLEDSQENERAEALRQASRIARFRLDELLK